MIEKEREEREGHVIEDGLMMGIILQEGQCEQGQK